jgi:hypothetical protein
MYTVPFIYYLQKLREKNTSQSKVSKDIKLHSHIFPLEAAHKKFYHQSKATMKPNEVNLYSFLRAAVKPAAGTPETIRERKIQGLWDPHQCTSVQKP